MTDWSHILDTSVNLGLGGFLMAAGRWLGRRLDLPVVTLQLENERLRGDLKRLGEKYDNLEARALAVAVKARQDATVADDFADDLPTAVRNKADIIAKKPPSLPPETKQELRDYIEKTPTDPNPIIPEHRWRR